MVRGDGGKNPAGKPVSTGLDRVFPRGISQEALRGTGPMATAANAHVPLETMEEDTDTVSQPPVAGRVGVGSVDDGQIQQGTLGNGP